MTIKRAFERAIALWEATRETAAGDDFAALETAERIILAHRPTSLDEAASMLEVVMEQRGDGRSDGLDLQAMERIVSLLRDPSRIPVHRVPAPAPALGFQGRPA